MNQERIGVAPKQTKRASVTFGPQLRALLDSGQCVGKTLTAKLETLAGRYVAMTQQVPTNWTVETWSSALRAAAQVDLTSPAAALTLVSIAKLRKDSKLSYQLEALNPAQAFAVIAVAEQFKQAGGTIEDATAVQAFLAQLGVTMTTG